MGASFIDAISDPWIDDATAPRYTGADGDHPTQAGHDHLGDELARALRRVLRLR